MEGYHIPIRYRHHASQKCKRHNQRHLHTLMNKETAKLLIPIRIVVLDHHNLNSYLENHQSLQRCQKKHEYVIVVVPDSVIKPLAMMIKMIHASVSLAAVLTSFVYMSVSNRSNTDI
jgi:hypothetical protein